MWHRTFARCFAGAFPLATLALLHLGTPGCTTSCTLIPPAPPNGPSDWGTAVHSNCLLNIERLGRWYGRFEKLGPSDSPQQYMLPVGFNSIGAAPNVSQNVYVVVHGWARGYRDVVNSNPGILWWETAATSDGAWASDWAWSSTQADGIDVADSGMFQLILQQDLNAIVLGYSWIDDSATPGGDTTLDDVYTSEAYTCINGIRLATALQQAIAPAFWQNPQNRLHLIGHSHGSKVATVAALMLQRSGVPAAHLTILDAPESNIPLEANGANLLPFHLNQLSVAPPSGGTGTFVDSYVSYFGIGYSGSTPIDNVVEVKLDPSVLYSSDDPADQHSYSAEWYAGAASARIKYRDQNLPPIGMNWPPPPSNYAPALKQTWPGSVNNVSQWRLNNDGTPMHTYAYSFPALQVSEEDSSNNNVAFNNGVLTMTATSGTAWFEGSYSNFDTDQYGVGFTMDWNNPTDGDYVVVTVQSPEERSQEVVLVLDGRSFTGSLTSFPLSFAADVTDPSFYVFYIPAAGNQQGSVVLKNFQSIMVAKTGTGEPPTRRRSQPSASPK